MKTIRIALCGWLILTGCETTGGKTTPPKSSKSGGSMAAAGGAPGPSGTVVVANPAQPASAAACAPGFTRPCQSGELPGTEACRADGSAWGACQPLIGVVQQPYGPRVLNICDDNAGPNCPALSRIFTNQALTVPGKTYSDTIPYTLDLATWAKEYYHGELASYYPGSLDPNFPWLPAGTYVGPGLAVYTNQPILIGNGGPAGMSSNYPCNLFGQNDPLYGPCITVGGAQQTVYTASIRRAREMIGNNNFLDPNDANIERGAIIATFLHDQNTSASNLSAPAGIMPLNYFALLLDDLARDMPGNAGVQALAKEYPRYAAQVATTEGPYTYWYNAVFAPPAVHILQLEVQGYTGQSLADLYLATGNRTALSLSGGAASYLMGYSGGICAPDSNVPGGTWYGYPGGCNAALAEVQTSFWGASRGYDDGGVAQGGPDYPQALLAILSDAQARLKANPADPVARQEVSFAVWGYNQLRNERDTEYLVGNFLNANILGEMLRLAVRLEEFRFRYPGSVPLGGYYEDAERWIRNQADQSRISSFVAGYIPSGPSGVPIFNQVGARAKGTFLTDSWDVAATQCASFFDNNDGYAVMQGVYEAWRHAVDIDPLYPNVAWVNLDLNAATPYMDIYSEIPYRGLVTVKLKKNIGPITQVAVRIPSWASLSQVSVTQAGAPVAWSPNADYIVISNVVPGASYQVRFPMTASYQRIVQWAPGSNDTTPTLTLTGTFLGDTMVAVNPPQPGCVPRYQDPQHQGWLAQISGTSVTEVAAPMVGVTRFVPSNPIPAALVQVAPDGSFFAQPNGGNLSFGAPKNLGATGNQIQFADINGDGLADLVQIAPNGSFFVQLNLGGGAWGPPKNIGATGNKMFFADVNGDGLADLMQVYPNGTIIAQYNQGGGSWAAPKTVGATGNPVMFGDLDGDGLADLIQITPNGTILAQRNLGDAVFAAPITIGATGNKVQIADVNGDGLADLVQIEPSGEIFVQVNQGGFSFGNPVVVGATGNRVLFAPVFAE